MTTPNVTYEGELAVVTQGDTSTESQIGLTVYKIERGVRTPYTGNLSFRVQICNDGTYANSTNGTLQAIAFGSVLQEAHQAGKDITFYAPLAGVAGAEDLTITTLVHGETITVGPRVYEVDGGTGILGTSHEAIDISAYGTKALGTITIAEPVTAGDDFTIGPRLYTFVAGDTANADGEISMGASEAETKVNIVAAINGTDAINTANPIVSAATFAADTCICTARLAGVAANSVVFIEGTLTHASNVLDGSGTLGGTDPGVAATATECGDAFVAALAADAPEAVATGVNAVGTVTVTANETGNLGIAATETSAGASWGNATLVGGVNAPGAGAVFEIDDGTGQTYTIRCSPGQLSSAPFSCAPLQHVIAAP